jgi:periplasmic divalent cation tolerance protein
MFLLRVPVAREMIEIHWTSGSLDEARKVARFLVQERLVASAQIIPWIESVYLLDNTLDTTQETKILFKTFKEHYEVVKEVIEKECKYEIPEITWFTIEGGNVAFLEWMKNSIKI